MEEHELEGRPLISDHGVEDRAYRPAVAIQVSRYYTFLWVLCILLHSLLIVLHIFMVVVYVNGWERSVLVSLGVPSTEVSTGIVIISQVFTTLYTAAVVLMLQQVALHHDIARAYQSVTTLHDRVTAWSGVGASVLTLYRQLALRTTVLGVLMISGYLFLISVLHITTPALFTLVAYNQTTYLNVNATSHLPDGTWSLSNVLSEEVDYALVLQVIDLIPSLSVFVDGVDTTSGLVGSTVYSSLGDNEGTGSINVQAAAFLVHCGIMEIVDVVWENVTSGSIPPCCPQYGLWNFTVAGVEECIVQLDSRQILNGSLVFTAVTCLNNTVALIPPSNTPLNDVDGTQLPQVNMSKWDPELPINVSLVGCNLDVLDYEIPVDSQTKLNLGDPAQQLSSTWMAWAPTEQAHNLDSILASLTWVSAGDVNSYTNGRLGSHNDLYGGTSGALTGTKLQLEEALGNLSAATAWMVNAVPDYGLKSNEPEEAVVAVVTTVNQLQIRLPDLVAGFMVSLLLFAFSIYLSWPYNVSVDRSHFPDTLGVLQVLWLVGRSPGVARNLANRALDPGVQSLRRAGMEERQARLLDGESRNVVAGRFVPW